MTFEESLERALRSRTPGSELRSLAEAFLARGEDQSAVLQRFEKARQQLRQAGREADEDAVMDVMDCLVGWCSSHAKLAPRT